MCLSRDDLSRPDTDNTVAFSVFTAILASYRPENTESPIRTVLMSSRKFSSGHGSAVSGWAWRGGEVETLEFDTALPGDGGGMEGGGGGIEGEGEAPSSLSAALVCASSLADWSAPLGRDALLALSGCLACLLEGGVRFCGGGGGGVGIAFAVAVQLETRTSIASMSMVCCLAIWRRVERRAAISSLREEVTLWKSSTETQLEWLVASEHTSKVSAGVSIASDCSDSEGRDGGAGEGEGGGGRAVVGVSGVPSSWQPSAGVGLHETSHCGLLSWAGRREGLLS